MSDRQNVAQLLTKAYDLLESGDINQAIVLGKQLIELKHARGFVVIALAYEQQGNINEAITVLKDGIAKVPGAWPLWELLGNIYSDQKQFPEAYSAYNKALSCPNVDKALINYNLSILLKREGKFDQALSICEAIDSMDLKTKKEALKLSLLNELSKYDEVVELGNKIISNIFAQEKISDDQFQDLARTYSEIGRAHWLGKYDKQLTWENAWRALEWDRGEPGALWLVREIISRKSPNSKWFSIIAKGKWHTAIEAGKPAPLFRTSYEIVCDTKEDALQNVQDLEPVEVRSSITIESIEEKENCPDNQQGVYWRSGYSFSDS
jgi:tetratricopeptide (TPR) repeat protein